MRHLRTTLLLLLALAAGLTASGASAAPDRYLGGYTRVAQGGGMSLDQAVAQVRRETGGRILSAETVRANGRKVHRIKVLTDGNKVRIIHKPAE
ncbi:MAG TPA: hypothetical protein VIQ22_00900 [Gammaproteobacteria bacterium]